ncbi:MAG: hypothetical protein H6657_20730 [Ardenticatenaceae bacterium]|nr:hypothetical protein [Anaerolineales bacterium]MCB8979843.1 hypothetical protein [Ardenticatenaceae bacterium]
MSNVMNQSANLSSPLGTFVAKFGATKARSKGNLWSGIVFIVFGVIGLLVGVLAAVSETGSSVVGFCGGVGLLSIAGGSWAIWTHRQEKDMAVQVYQDGLTMHKNGRSTTMRWDEIQNLDVIVTYNRQIRASFYNYTLKDTHGQTMRLNLTPGNLENPDQLARTIQQEVTRRQLAHAFTKLNAGMAVEFGPLSVTTDGIMNGRSHLPWSKFKEARLTYKGYFRIWTRDSTKTWARIEMQKMANLFTFLALADQLSGQR